MSTRGRALLVPAYLFVALVAGGSAQGIWANLMLQLLGIALLCWALLARREGAIPLAGRHLLMLSAAAAALVAGQLLPLPPALWTALPGRGFVIDGLRLLSERPGWMSLSLAPERTLSALFSLVVPIAVIAAMVRTQAFYASWLVVAVLAATLAGALLGVVQVSGGDAYYLYRYSAFGAACGFFANSNHMATLLLASLPFATALASDQWDRRPDPGARLLIGGLTLAGCLLIAAAIVLNGSFAILLLGLPVAIASALIPGWQRRAHLRRFLLPAALVALVAAIAIGALASDRLRDINQTSLSTRLDYWSHSAPLAERYGVSGAGAGSFAGLYRQIEDPATISRFVVNHAHNDYLEALIDVGAPGVVLLALFLWWWAKAVRATWTQTVAEPYLRAASIASATILAHSLVDFPLRTAAIAALFAACVGLLARRARPIPVHRHGELWPSRHVTIG